jgi:hypothetical protein
MFADDTACVASGHNLQDLVSFVNTEIKKIAGWFRANRMAVNVSKTKFIIFHTKGKIIDNDIHLTYDDNEPNENNPSLIHNIERFYTNHLNPQCRAYKILGIYIDEHLSFDFHTTHIISKLNRSLYCMNKVKNFLPPAAMKSLYYALIHSHLSYCPIITSCATNTNIQKIFKTQKKAIRIISNKQIRDHTGPLFTFHKILPYPKLISFAKLIFSHSVVFEYGLDSFSNVWTTNTNRIDNPHNLRHTNHFVIPHPRIELFKKSPLYSIPTLWNSLGDLSLQSCRATFKIGLKEKLLSENET